ncbi:hypothetical protein FRC12_007576, partial [Ceratobasidium sp. 428]
MDSDHKLVPSDPDPDTFEFLPVVTPIGKVTAGVRYRLCTNFRLVSLGSIEGLPEQRVSWAALIKGESARPGRPTIRNNPLPVREPALNLDEGSEYFPKVKASWSKPSREDYGPSNHLASAIPSSRTWAGYQEGVDLSRSKSLN